MRIFTAGAYVVVEFENGFRMVVDSRAKVEKVRQAVTGRNQLRAL